MDAKHTPTPWHVGKKGEFKRAEHFVYAMDGWQIAQCNEFRPLAEENADFIARACNAHDELVAHLKIAVQWLQTLPQTSMTENQIAAWEKVIGMAEGQQ